ncbi:hypothetical protein CgunFtcFv8_012045 [Champsocephalus gunnari]|uniref:Uncharacterized protein n=2 Tax=Channichthyidae TaxID=30806 RepID=A0AAN8D7V8_CHAGU|nr:hypothetical protein KUCAC02_025428 [Chaenocephalus aceratus]KAK5917129.1 hypothetical protein CgunFtcFv8_012045 [Champsocephalus gunnari]
METVSHPLPPWCSARPLFPLIVPTGVNADSPLVEVSTDHPLVTSRLRSGKKELTSARRGGPQPTDGRQRRGSGLQPLARNSGGKGRQKMRRGRRREAVWGSKRGKRRRRFIECSDTS